MKTPRKMNPNSLKNLRPGFFLKAGKTKTKWQWNTQLACSTPEELEDVKANLRLEAENEGVTVPVFLGRLLKIRYLERGAK
jgi:hypothetical protein